MKFKNGMRPVHPGEMLREDYLAPLRMSAHALAKALRVAASRINDVVTEKRDIIGRTHHAGDARILRRTGRRGPSTAGDHERVWALAIP